MADDFTKLIQLSQTLEQLLEKRFNATGRGLHEKLNSVQSQIPENIQRKIRYIATIRNKATHEDVKIAKQNYASVRKAYDEAFTYLSGGISFWTLLKRKLFVAAIAMIVFAIWYYSRK